MDISSLTPDKQVKLQYWLDVIRQCRASGLTNRAWCEQHQISLKSYYYWIAKIRRLALEELPRKHNTTHSRPDRNTALLPEVSSEFAYLFLTDARPILLPQPYCISGTSASKFLKIHPVNH